VVHSHDILKRYRTLIAAIGVGVACAPLAGESSGNDPMPPAWRAILSDGGLSPEPESLGPYLAQFAPAEEERERIAKLLDRFSDEEFGTREEALAVLLETEVVPHDLLAAKLFGDDPEAAWRARKVAQRASRPDPVLHFAVLRVIAHKRMQGLTAPLIGSAQSFAGLPHLDDALDYALARTTMPGMVKREMLTASMPTPCRIVALQAFARTRGKAVLPQVRELLTVDDDELNAAAVIAATALGQRDVLPTLAASLMSHDRNTRIRSIYVLRKATQQHFGYSVDAGESERESAAKRWRDWLDKRGEVVKLKPTPVRAPLLLGRTLVAFRADNRVVEYDSRGLAVWRANVTTPVGVSADLTGRRAVASYEGRSAFVYDADGEIIQIVRLGGRPFSARLISGGRVLVTDTSERRVYEYLPNGRRAWSHYSRSRPMDARRMPTGNTLVAAADNRNDVVERNSKNSVVWKLSDLKSPRAVQRLASGNTLVAEAQAGTVTEYTPAKKVAWRISQLPRPSDCQRLPDGNTLIATQTGAYEVTKEGKVVWSVRGRDITAVCRY